MGRGLFVTFVVAVALLSSCISALGQAPKDQRLERINNAPNASQGRFKNSLEQERPTFSAMLGGYLDAVFLSNAKRNPDAEMPRYRRASIPKPPKDELQVTWLFHSTTVIDIAGLRVLTDPVFSERASPLRFAGPKRFMPSPIALEKLHDVDVVLISHDHYDHLDEESIKVLAQRDLRFIVPLGVGAHLEHWGVHPSRITERNWWQDIVVENVRLTCVPSRHFSGRSLTTQNTTLWAGWTLTSKNARVYFSGDTALSPDFERIGEELGPFDIAMLEVGAYNQLWRDSHLGPEQAILAHRLLGAKRLLPLHWGTFDLAFHSVTEPIERLMSEAELQGVELLLPMPGQSVNGAFEFTRWWPEMKWKTKEQSPLSATAVDHDALQKRAEKRSW